MPPSKIRDFVFNRAVGLCEYCKSPANISSQAFVIEHIQPKSKGGLENETNFALACQGCNNFKYNKVAGFDVVTGDFTDFFHPRKDEWNEHFRWSDDVLDVLGISALGRVTVEELKLNRNELRNLRQLLAGVGSHPPK